MDELDFRAEIGAIQLPCEVNINPLNRAEETVLMEPDGGSQC